MLAFGSGCGDAFDECFLGEEEEQNRGEDDQGAGGHEEMPACAAGFALEILQAQGEGELLGALEVDEGA